LRSVWLILLVGGCASKHAGTEWPVSLRVEGPDATAAHPDLPPLEPDRALSREAASDTAWAAREVVEHPVALWWQFVPLSGVLRPRPELDRGLLEADRGRVEQWFQDRGWLQAEVSGVVEPRGKRKAALRLVVDTGERRMARHELGLPQSVTAARAAQLRALTPERGFYDAEQAQSAAAAMAHLLATRGHGLAMVTPELQEAQNDLTVVYRVEPGPLVRFGPLQWPDRTAAERARLDKRFGDWVPLGTPWNVSVLDRLTGHLTALQAFDGAHAEAGDQANGDAVAVRIALTDAPPAEVEPLSELGADGAFWSAALGFEVRANHVQRRLSSLNTRTLLGYRAIPTLVEPGLFTGNHGPLLTHDTELDLAPRSRQQIRLHTRAGTQLDVRRGFHSASAAGGGGLRWALSESTHLTAAWLIQRWHFTPWPEQRDVFVRWFAEPSAPSRDRFLSAYTLSHASLELNVDTLDRPVDPIRGIHLFAAGVPFGLADSTPYLRGEADIRTFVAPTGPRWTLATRAWAGLNAFSDRHLRLLGSRFFLGGSDDMRGWSSRTLAAPGYTGNIDDVRAGGDTMLHAALESRHRPHPDLTLLGFAEVGRVWDIAAHLDATSPPIGLEALAADIGIGAEILTPLGWGRVAAAWQPYAVRDVAHQAPRYGLQGTLSQAF
jgi:hypothetical protein